jgi:hypothetical protein
MTLPRGTGRRAFDASGRAFARARSVSTPLLNIGRVGEPGVTAPMAAKKTAKKATKKTTKKTSKKAAKKR